jgi:hypothetical protein
MIRPTTALALGYAGLIPFIALSLAVRTGIAAELIAAMPWLVGYGAVILSFMGGARWGLAVLTAQPDRQARDLMLSVLPALIGWASLIVPPPLALPLLIAAFTLLLFDDLRLVAAGFAPDWYGRLRLRLTVIVVIALALAWA